MEHFWMVYVDGQTGSTVKHNDVINARKEAERLAALNVGVKVYVLGVSGVCIKPPAVQWLDEPFDSRDLPF
jgi:hypothetical protein